MAVEADTDVRLVLAHGLTHARLVHGQVVLWPVHAGCAPGHGSENEFGHLPEGRIRGRQLTHRQVPGLVVGEPLNDTPDRVVSVPPASHQQRYLVVRLPDGAEGRQKHTPRKPERPCPYASSGSRALHNQFRTLPAFA